MKRWYLARLPFLVGLTFTLTTLLALCPAARAQNGCTGAGVADNVSQPGCMPATPAPEPTSVSSEDPPAGNGNDVFNQWHLEGQWNGQVCRSQGQWSGAAPGYIHIELTRGTTQQSAPAYGGPSPGSSIPEVRAVYSLYDAGGRQVAQGEVATSNGISTAFANASNPYALSPSGTRVWYYSANSLNPQGNLTFSSADGVHVFGGTAYLSNASYQTVASANYTACTTTSPSVPIARSTRRPAALINPPA
jgi:hypothetical protein